MSTLPTRLDLRAKENRKIAFAWWYAWSLEFKDCDPALPMLNYLFNRFELNVEQRYWVCWLYGCTYYLPTVWVIWNEFPDFELVGVDRLREWELANKSRLRYQSDTKWNRGHLTNMFISYKNWVGDSSQKEHFFKFITSSSKDNFDKLWSEVNKNLHKFGRYATWFYLQTLSECVGLSLYPRSLMLSDYEGSRSHRNGLCYAIGKDEWVDQKLTPEQYSFLEDQAENLIQETSSVWDCLPEPFGMETVCCSFKKLFRKKQGRYLGYYLDRQAEEIAKVESDGWNGINWKPLWDFRAECLHPKLSASKHIDTKKMEYFLDTGKLLNLELFNEI